MTFDDAKAELRKAYLGMGFALSAETAETLEFTISDSTYPLKLSQERIAEYQLVSGELSKYKLDNGVSIIGPKYREIRLIATDVGSSPYQKFSFGDVSGSDMHVTIGPASPVFKHKLACSGIGNDFIANRLNTSRHFDLYRILSMMRTIKVHNVPGSSLDEVEIRSDQIIESSLFELAYLRNVALQRSVRWPPNRVVDDSSEEEDESKNQFPMGGALYSSELSKFYIRGHSADPYIQFLSFYHVAEYFFIQIADKNLYSQISRILRDPKFRDTPTHLDKIIQSISIHKRDTREEDMLRAVLEEFIEEDELIAELARIEAQHGEKIYTVKTQSFGYDLERLSLQKGHVYGALSKRIKTIRNALVHSSDRHERKSRYVPGAEANSVLRREIPIMRYLAERIIVGSATPKVQ